MGQGSVHGPGLLAHAESPSGTRGLQRGVHALGQGSVHDPVLDGRARREGVARVLGPHPRLEVRFAVGPAVDVGDGDGANRAQGDEVLVDAPQGPGGLDVGRGGACAQVVHAMGQGGAHGAGPEALAWVHALPATHFFQ